MPAHVRSAPPSPEPPAPVVSAPTLEPGHAGTPVLPRPSEEISGPLTLFQANVLVAMLAGFLARKGDGHPGPDTMGLGLLILHVLVAWERFKKELAQKKRPPPKNKPARGKVRKPG